jgi:ABC-type Fe3+-siderophore transport system permease subunit
MESREAKNGSFTVLCLCYVHINFYLLSVTMVTTRRVYQLKNLYASSRVIVQTVGSRGEIEWKTFILCRLLAVTNLISYVFSWRTVDGVSLDNDKASVVNVTSIKDKESGFKSDSNQVGLYSSQFLIFGLESLVDWIIN